jgi:hypothetical protein
MIKLVSRLGQVVRRSAIDHFRLDQVSEIELIDRVKHKHIPLPKLPNDGSHSRQTLVSAQC